MLAGGKVRACSFLETSFATSSDIQDEALRYMGMAWVPNDT